MYILYTSQQQNTLGDVTPTEHFVYILYTSQQQNTLDGGDVYIIHITTTEHFRW